LRRYAVSIFDWKIGVELMGASRQRNTRQRLVFTFALLQIKAYVVHGVVAVSHAASPYSAMGH
jgi:hypothetical protein